MEEFEGFFDGQAGLGAGGCGVALEAAGAAAVDLLEDGGLAPADGPDGGGVDAGFAAVGGKSAEDGGELVGQGDEAQVGVPQT